VEIKANDVKALREKTGAGMMDCKKALIEANVIFLQLKSYCANGELLESKNELAVQQMKVEFSLLKMLKNWS